MELASHKTDVGQNVKKEYALINMHDFLSIYLNVSVEFT